MSKERPKNMAASVRARLQTHSQMHHEDFQLVLTRFASSQGLKLEVSFEVPIPHEQAQTKADETRAGLKELGLDDNVSSS